MYQECLKLVFKSVSRVVKGSFMGVSIAFVFIEVIAATRACGGLVYCRILFYTMKIGLFAIF